jgi:heme-degrading monooxygenase HmoA
MFETVTAGTWWVDETNAAAFGEAWAAFAAWSSSQPGAGTLRLGRDRAEPSRYVSFGPWASLQAVRAWKANPEMRERMAKVLQYVQDFQSYELDLIATASLGDSTPGLVSNSQ